jgi:hypothetical protein
MGRTPYTLEGCWISMLQDFNFKIVHRAGARHANVDALSYNQLIHMMRMGILGWKYKMRRKMLMWHMSGNPLPCVRISLLFLRMLMLN